MKSALLELYRLIVETPTLSMTEVGKYEFGYQVIKRILDSDEYTNSYTQHGNGD